jgi:hypothetical protein
MEGGAKQNPRLQSSIGCNRVPDALHESLDAILTDLDEDKELLFLV